MKEKMKLSDIGVVLFMYAVCAYFYTQNLQLKPESLNGFETFYGNDNYVRI